MKTRIQQSVLKYRKQRWLNTRQLAEKAGCTPSFISQIEKGTALPSLSMVGKLAEALDISVSQLLAEESGFDREHFCLRKKDRRIVQYPDGKTTDQILSSNISAKKMEPLLSVIEPGGVSGEGEKMTHPAGTEEFVLVLKGHLVFTIDDEEIRLGKGDTLLFKGEIPHRWENRSKGRAEVLFIFTPPIW